MSTIYELILAYISLQPNGPYLIICLGPHSLHDHQPYMEIITHELLQLYWYGVDVTLPVSMRNHCSETVNVKAMLLQWIGDYRGQPKAFCQMQSPSHKFSCYQCAIQGFTVIGKTIFPGAWKYCSLNDLVRRGNGSKYNNPEKLSPNTPAPDEKLDEHFRSAAKLADKATKDGIHKKHPQHPCKETGIYVYIYLACYIYIYIYIYI